MARRNIQSILVVFLCVLTTINMVIAECVDEDGNSVSEGGAWSQCPNLCCWKSCTCVNGEPNCGPEACAGFRPKVGCQIASQPQGSDCCPEIC